MDYCAAGSGPARLAVLMSNSVEMALLLFGAGKAGVSVVPLNTSVTDSAVAAMIADSGAQPSPPPASIAGDSTAWPAPVDSVATRCSLGLDAPDATGGMDFAGWLDAAQSATAGTEVAPGSECNIIYSSGTTGLPKGIVHMHGGRMHWATDLAVALRYHSGAVTVCSLGLYSNISWARRCARSSRAARS